MFKLTSRTYTVAVVGIFELLISQIISFRMQYININIILGGIALIPKVQGSLVFARFSIFFLAHGVVSLIVQEFSQMTFAI